jgi:hypothetical protein
LPIRPERKHLYGPSWNAISLARRERAGWRCEWCQAEYRQPNPVTGSMVVLTVAHIDHDETNNSDGNLAALCQLCHNRHDIAHWVETRRRRKAQGDLFEKE